MLKRTLAEMDEVIAHHDLQALTPALRWLRDNQPGPLTRIGVAYLGLITLFLLVKVGAKISGVYPLSRLYRYQPRLAWYTTLMMSTGLTFGTISSLFGLSHGIINQAQYSALVAAVIGSAVVPTLIANALFLPRQLLPDLSNEAGTDTPITPVVPQPRKA